MANLKMDIKHTFEKSWKIDDDNFIFSLKYHIKQKEIMDINKEWIDFNYDGNFHKLSHLDMLQLKGFIDSYFKEVFV